MEMALRQSMLRPYPIAQRRGSMSMTLPVRAVTGFTVVGRAEISVTTAVRARFGRRIMSFGVKVATMTFVGAAVSECHFLHRRRTVAVAGPEAILLLAWRHQQPVIGKT